MSTIVFVGDSVTASANMTLENRWPQRVGVAAGFTTIINAGVPGNKSSQILARFQADVLEHVPDVVVMMFTVNDSANGVPLSTHEANYRTMIEAAQLAGAKVVLITPPVYRSSVANWRQPHELWVRLAGEYGCPLVDVARAYGWEYLADQNKFFALYIGGTDIVHQSLAGNNMIVSLCVEETQRDTFTIPIPESEPETPQEPEVCPVVTDELTLSLADLQRYGASEARLQRVTAALAGCEISP